MKRALVSLWLALGALWAGEPAAETAELIGQLGNRDTLLVLHTARRADGGWRVTGEYVVLSTMTRRFLEGERSPELGVTTLREGVTPILFGRPPTASFQGTWRDGAFRGTRYGPGGQERERFDFSESFAAMNRYSASVRCEADAEPYRSTLAYEFEDGRLKPGSFAWRSRRAPGGHGCSVDANDAIEQSNLAGGLRLLVGAAGAEGARCSITLRDLGGAVRVTAEHCAAQCGSQGYLEPVLVERRGACQLFRPHTR